MTTKELIKTDELDKELEIWNQTKSTIAKIVESKKGLTIDGHIEGKKAGYEVVKAARIELKYLISDINNKHKELKSVVNKKGKEIDTVKKELVELIKPDRDRLEADEKAYEAEQERIKAELEAKRQEKIRYRLAEMAAAQMELDHIWAEMVTDDEFEATVNDAAEKLAERKAKEQAEREAKERAEREAREAQETEAKLIRDRSDARIKALSDIRAIVDFGICISGTDDEYQEYYDSEKDRLVEIEAMEARIKAERAEKERLQREELEKIQAENRRYQEQLAKEKQERIDAENKRIAELRQIRIDALKQVDLCYKGNADLGIISSLEWSKLFGELSAEQKEKAARREALKPDLEKINEWIDKLLFHSKEQFEVSDKDLNEFYFSERRYIIDYLTDMKNNSILKR